MVKAPDTFCVLPFIETNISTNGAMRPCCAYDRFISEGNRPMSVQENTVLEILNSSDGREVRRRMLAGEKDPACGYCSRDEERGLKSMRMAVNEVWSASQGGSDLATNVERLSSEMESTNNYVSGALTHINLNMGNLCNLKCRMCNSDSSSMIASDKTHSRWGDARFSPARWRGAELVVAPQPVLGVWYQGFSPLDQHAGVIWSEGESIISLPSVPRAVSVAFDISLANAATVVITLGQHTIFRDTAPAGALSRTVDLIDGATKDPADLRLSATDDLGNCVRFGVGRVSFRRDVKFRNDVAFSRFPGGKQWFESTTFLKEEVFGKLHDVRQVRLIGGEPMLIAQCYDVMQHLVDQKVSGQIQLALSTNGTVLKEEFFDLARCFKSIVLQVSLDGFGRVNEYIRFPSTWDEIAKNLKRMTQTLSNAYVRVSSTIQTYNMLDIVDLVRWCDENGYRFHYSMVNSPRHLDVMTMPEPLRKEAAARLRRYAKRNDQKASLVTRDDRLLELATSLEEPAPDWTDRDLKTFMTFTNDLDATREQDFRTTFPEYVKMLEASGFEWASDRRFVS